MCSHKLSKSSHALFKRDNVTKKMNQTQVTHEEEAPVSPVCILKPVFMKGNDILAQYDDCYNSIIEFPRPEAKRMSMAKNPYNKLMSSYNRDSNNLLRTSDCTHHKKCDVIMEQKRVTGRNSDSFIEESLLYERSNSNDECVCQNDHSKPRLLLIVIRVIKLEILIGRIIRIWMVLWNGIRELVVILVL